MTRASQHVHDAAASTGPSQSVDASPRQGKKPRRLFSKDDKLAAAYIALRLVPPQLARAGTTKQIIAYVHGDHNVPFALGGPTTPQNCNLIAKDVHAAKTAKDIPAIAKSKRLNAGAKEFLRKIFAKDHGLQLQAPKLTRKGNLLLPCGRHSSWKKPLGKWNAVRREI